MGQALDQVEVARLCACYAEACLGARLATEAVAAAKRCLRSLPEPWPPKWRFLLAKAHLTRGDVRPARAVLSSLIADSTRDDDVALYEKWLDVAGWDGVDEVTKRRPNRLRRGPNRPEIARKTTDAIVRWTLITHGTRRSSDFPTRPCPSSGTRSAPSIVRFLPFLLYK